MTDVTLRALAAADKDRLLEWRNQPEIASCMAAADSGSRVASHCGAVSRTWSSVSAASRNNLARPPEEAPSRNSKAVKTAKAIRPRTTVKSSAVNC